MNHLKLYIIGNTPAAASAIENLRAICEDPLYSDWVLEVIDVLENPQLAEEDKIVAVPALVKCLPPPVQRMIGDLSSKEKVLLGLNIIAGNPESA